VLARIRSAVKYVIESFRWAFTASEKPSRDQVSASARFLLLMVFAVGVVAFAFSITRSYLFAMLYGQPVPTLSGVEGLIASMASIVVIVAATLYLLFKIR